MNRSTLRVAVVVILLLIATRWLVARVPALSRFRGVI